MLLGQRIRFFRILRGMTQKQLGKLMGYTDDTADIRISQYESESRKPTGDTIDLFAKALHISPYAMCIHSFHCLEEIMHTLFALEDMYGLSVENIDGKICVSIPEPSCDESFVVSTFLEMWSDIAQEYREGRIGKEYYDEWRYQFPYGKRPVPVEMSVKRKKRGRKPTKKQDDCVVNDLTHSAQ